VERPVAELADDRAARPVVHESGYASGAPGGVAAAKAPAPRAAMAAPLMRAQTGAMDQAVAVAPSTIASDATARELGELFEYRIAQPVTIRKDESAMLPFLQQAIEGRKLLIYSDHSSQHPNNAAELENSSGKTLDGGPITVYDGGAYGGEALMETLKAGDKRLISYAVDLGTRITEAFGAKAAIAREVHASRGILTSRLAAEETRTYTVRNVDGKAKTLIIEHPLRTTYTLLNQKPKEKTATAYRFEIQLAANATVEFPVAEEHVYDQTYMVANLTPDVLLTYVSNRSLNDQARGQMQRIADQKSQIAENDRALQEADRQTRELTSDEDRIRHNIESLNNVSGQQQQVQTYARQLDAHEQQLAALRDRQAELQKKKSALDAEVAKLIEGLAF